MEPPNSGMGGRPEAPFSAAARPSTAVIPPTPLSSDSLRRALRCVYFRETGEVLGEKEQRSGDEATSSVFSSIFPSAVSVMTAKTAAPPPLRLSPTHAVTRSELLSKRMVERTQAEAKDRLTVGGRVRPKRGPFGPCKSEQRLMLRYLMGQDDCAEELRTMLQQEFDAAFQGTARLNLVATSRPVRSQRCSAEQRSKVAVKKDGMGRQRRKAEEKRTGNAVDGVEHEDDALSFAALPLGFTVAPLREDGGATAAPSAPAEDESENEQQKGGTDNGFWTKGYVQRQLDALRRSLASDNSYRTLFDLYASCAVVMREQERIGRSHCNFSQLNRRLLSSAARQEAQRQRAACVKAIWALRPSEVQDFYKELAAHLQASRKVPLSVRRSPGARFDGKQASVRFSHVYSRQDGRGLLSGGGGEGSELVGPLAHRRLLMAGRISPLRAQTEEFGLEHAWATVICVVRALRCWSSVREEALEFALRLKPAKELALHITKWEKVKEVLLRNLHRRREKKYGPSADTIRTFLRTRQMLQRTLRAAHQFRLHVVYLQRQWRRHRSHVVARKLLLHAQWIKFECELLGVENVFIFPPSSITHRLFKGMSWRQLEVEDRVCVTPRGGVSFHRRTQAVDVLYDRLQEQMQQVGGALRPSRSQPSLVVSEHDVFASASVATRYSKRSLSSCIPQTSLFLMCKVPELRYYIACCHRDGAATKTLADSDVDETNAKWLLPPERETPRRVGTHASVGRTTNFRFKLTEERPSSGGDGTAEGKRPRKFSCYSNKAAAAARRIRRPSVVLTPSEPFSAITNAQSANSRARWAAAINSISPHRRSVAKSSRRAVIRLSDTKKENDTPPSVVLAAQPSSNGARTMHSIPAPPLHDLHISTSPYVSSLDAQRGRNRSPTRNVAGATPPHSGRGSPTGKVPRSDVHYARLLHCATPEQMRVFLLTPTQITRESKKWVPSTDAFRPAEKKDHRVERQASKMQKWMPSSLHGRGNGDPENERAAPLRHPRRSEGSFSDGTFQLSESEGWEVEGSAAQRPSLWDGSHAEFVENAPPSGSRLGEISDPPSGHHRPSAPFRSLLNGRAMDWTRQVEVRKSGPNDEGAWNGSISRVKLSKGTMAAAAAARPSTAGGRFSALELRSVGESAVSQRDVGGLRKSRRVFFVGGADAGKITLADDASHRSSGGRQKARPHTGDVRISSDKACGAVAPPLSSRSQRLPKRRQTADLDTRVVPSMPL